MRCITNLLQVPLVTKLAHEIILVLEWAVCLLVWRRTQRLVIQ